VHLVGCTITIYYDGRTYEHQNYKLLTQQTVRYIEVTFFEPKKSSSGYH